MFNRDMEILRNRPIPDQAYVYDKLPYYREWPVDRNHPLFNEPCIDLRALGVAGENFYFPHTRGSIPQLWVRESVALRILSVSTRLHESGLEFYVHDAYRPALVQFTKHMECRAQERLLHPDWPESRVIEEATKQWSLGPERDEDVDPLSPSPHGSGAAFDCGIRVLGGGHLWMGTKHDDTSALARTDALEKLVGPLTELEHEARANRRMLYFVLREEGFWVNPSEYWHASWGDQYGAKLLAAYTGMEAPAWYGACNPFVRT